jgi:hypothetical protein
MKSIKSALTHLAAAAIFYYATIWLVMLVIVGTVAQKFFGLQACLEKYFSAWFLQPMDMPIYLPSGRFVMAVIMVNLAAKLIVATKWKWKMAGINITHFGVMLLMIGGVITAYTTTEGSLALREGTSSSIFQDFHKLELAVTDRAPKDHDAITAFSDGFFTEGSTFSDSEIPFTFKVVHFYKNCKPVRRSNPSDTLRQNAKRFQFKELPTANNDQNAGGIEVKISGASPEDNGIYIFFNSPNKGASTATIKDTEGKSYEITLRPRHYQLPFTVKLLDFEKLDHGGTMMARAFSSKVTITQGDSSEDSKIYMNHPLRRDGYTLYQASFNQGGPMGVETSVFQVVYNKGRLMPYFAIIVITLGLLIHCLIQVPKLLSAQKESDSLPAPSENQENSL